MHPVAGVDDGRSAFSSKQMRRARGFMTDDDDVRRHRFQVAGRVQQSLPFGHAAGGSGEIQDVGAQPFFGQFERRSGPGRRLEKQIYDRFPSQRRNFLDRPGGDFSQGFGRIQNDLDIFNGQLLDCPAGLCGSAMP